MRDVPVVELPIVDSLHPRPPHMPLAIPEDLAPRLMRLHGNPAAWWIGQFLRFLLKPQPHLQRDIDSTTTRMGFQNPIVGYVRRHLHITVLRQCIQHCMRQLSTSLEGQVLSNRMWAVSCCGWLRQREGKVLFPVPLSRQGTTFGSRGFASVLLS